MKAMAKKLASATFAVIGLVVLASGCNPTRPNMPSFAADAQPIFMAHCTRCHGSNGPDGGFLGDPPNYPNPGTASLICHFDVYGDDPPGCGDVDGGIAPGCKVGAKSCLKYFVLEDYIRTRASLTTTMPPPPASPLDPWELDVLGAWARNPIP
jgi:hypothetical protein